MPVTPLESTTDRDKGNREKKDIALFQNGIMLIKRTKREERKKTAW